MTFVWSICDKTDNVVERYVVARCYQENGIIHFHFIVVGVDVAASGVKVFSFAMQFQQWGLFALL
jgi:hypothetical protein